MSTFEPSIFTESEIVRRHSAIRAGLAENHVDACLLSSADNVYYVTGMPLLSEWGRPMLAVLDTDGPVTIIGAQIELETMRQQAVACDVVPYDDQRDVRLHSLGIAMELLRSSGEGELTIGIERSVVPVDIYEALVERFPGFRFVDVSPIINRVRIIKSDEEFAILRMAAQVAKIGANAFLEALTPGNTELAVAGHAVSAMNKALGALYPQGATSTYVYAQFGDHSLSPHLHATGRRLRQGEIVALNVFPVVWGYCIELERTLVLGRPTDRQQELLNTLNHSFDLGKRLYVEGKNLGDLHRDCTKVINDAGLSEYIRHGTGHAHGIMVGSASREELGEIREYSTGTLAVGMTNSIEPGFYIPEEGGFRHSDVMLLTAEGPECITEFPHDLAL